VQRRVRAAFEHNCDGSLTSGELVQFVFNADEPKHKHRVSILRAADSVAAEMGWERSLINREVRYRSPAAVIAEVQAHAKITALRAGLQAPLITPHSPDKQQ
jgi:hypothetical protein